MTRSNAAPAPQNSARDNTGNDIGEHKRSGANPKLQADRHRGPAGPRQPALTTPLPLLATFSLLLLSIVGPPLADATTALPGNRPLALKFVPNQGQWPEALQYFTRADDLDALFTARHVELRLRDGKRTQRLRLRPLGANPQATLRPESPRPTKINLFRGKDPEQWRTGIPSYDQLRYAGLYPDIDLAFRTQERRLAYDFVVHPGADPDQIRVAVEGAQSLALEPDGRLRVTLADGRHLYQQPPFIFQRRDGEPQPVAGGFLILASQATDDQAPTYGFAIGP